MGGRRRRRRSRAARRRQAQEEQAQPATPAAPGDGLGGVRARAGPAAAAAVVRGLRRHLRLLGQIRIESAVVADSGCDPVAARRRRCAREDAPVSSGCERRRLLRRIQIEIIAPSVGCRPSSLAPIALAEDRDIDDDFVDVRGERAPQRRHRDARQNHKEWRRQEVHPPRGPIVVVGAVIGRRLPDPARDGCRQGQPQEASHRRRGRRVRPGAVEAAEPAENRRRREGLLRGILFLRVVLGLELRRRARCSRRRRLRERVVLKPRAAEFGSTPMAEQRAEHARREVDPPVVAPTLPLRRRESGRRSGSQVRVHPDVVVVVARRRVRGHESIHALRGEQLRVVAQAEDDGVHLRLVLRLLPPDRRDDGGGG